MDLISTAIATINQASTHKSVTALVPNNKIIRLCLSKLLKLGYIRGFTILNKRSLKVYMKFDQNNKPTITNVSRISTPGKRVYISSRALKSKTIGVNVLSDKVLMITSSLGIITETEAKLFNIGGEILFSIN